MMDNRKKYGTFFFLLTYAVNAWGMVRDNRYFPWYARPFHRTADEQSRIDTGLFFTSAGSAVGNEVKERIPIPELWGLYNQKQMSDAIVELGMTTPLLAQWQKYKKIIWTVDGSVKSEGMYIYGDYNITNNFSVGGSLFFGHFEATQTFIIPKETKKSLWLTPSQEVELDAERRQMFEMLNLSQVQWSTTAASDMELHVRFGTVKEYVAKCRAIDIGTSFFVYIPTAPFRPVNNPAAIPIGGNKLVGLAWGLDGAFELKEDWTAGFQFSVSKRLSKTQQIRMPIQHEPYMFGAIVGPAKVNPNPVVYFNPYVTIGALRQSLSASVGYTVSYSAGAVITDMRPLSEQLLIPTTLNEVNNKTEWCAEYINILFAYDFHADQKKDTIHSLVTATWDIPVHFMGSHDFARSQMVTIGVEFRF